MATFIEKLRQTTATARASIAEKMKERFDSLVPQIEREAGNGSDFFWTELVPPLSDIEADSLGDIFSDFGFDVELTQSDSGDGVDTLCLSWRVKSESQEVSTLELL